MGKNSDSIGLHVPSNQQGFSSSFTCVNYPLLTAYQDRAPMLVDEDPGNDKITVAMDGQDFGDPRQQLHPLLGQLGQSQVLCMG